MQNLLIIGVIVIIGIGGFVLLQTATEPADMDETMMIEEVATDDTMAMDEADMEQDMMDADPANDPTMDTQTASPNIVEAAIATPELSTLVTAVTQAELATTLQSDGPFTVFAPDNNAFANLPPATLESLLEPENIADLQSILTYHVVPGAVLSSDLTDGMVVETVNGETLTINLDDGDVSINGSAGVTMADIQTSNGVVHIINGVLLPEGTE